MSDTISGREGFAMELTRTIVKSLAEIERLAAENADLKTKMPPQNSSGDIWSGSAGTGDMLEELNRLRAENAKLTQTNHRMEEDIVVLKDALNSYGHPLGTGNVEGHIETIDA